MTPLSVSSADTIAAGEQARATSDAVTETPSRDRRHAFIPACSARLSAHQIAFALQGEGARGGGGVLLVAVEPVARPE